MRKVSLKVLEFFVPKRVRTLYLKAMKFLKVGIKDEMTVPHNLLT